jgi:hypothetical protein
MRGEVSGASKQRGLEVGKRSDQKIRREEAGDWRRKKKLSLSTARELA